MRIAIFGSGYVGLVTGACLADGGHHVTCVDVDSERVARLRAGESPIWEPGLEELLRGNLAQGRLEFTDDAAEALEDARVAFVAVGTPQAPDGSADLRYVDDVARRIGELARRDLLVVNKSTVPVGTAARVRALIEEGLAARGAGHRVGVASNPEFLKEGAAIADFKHGDRIVVGTEAAEDEELLRLVYEPFNRQREKIIAMDIPSAELTKYAANAMLAAKISFMNEIAAISEAAGADIERVRQGIGSDPRIGYQFLYAGAGYGGSCFPKDVAALAHTARQAGCEPLILDAVEAVNARQKGTLLRRLDELLPGLAGRTVAVWGLAFKPRTDDVREAPALHLVRGLLAAGCTVRAYDPVATGTFGAALGEEAARVEFADSALDAARGADALAICTEWEEFRAFDAEGLTERMAGRLIVDGRNLYDPARVAAAGFAYASVGRRIAGLPAEEGAGQPPAGSPSRAAIPASIRS